MFDPRRDSQQIDVKSVGRVMKEIMEPGHAHLNPRSIDLIDPERWTRDIRDFQEQTQTSCIPELLQVRLPSR
jgi:hypothetical protein